MNVYGLLAAGLGGILLGLAAGYGLARRFWRSAKRMAARSRGSEHLMELGRLVGGLAHEIKNPLSTINLNLKLLAEDLHHYPDETHRRWLRRLESVQDETARVKNTLDDFLRYAGKMELTATLVDVRKLVEELVDFFSPQADAARVILRTALPETPVLCRLDANLIKQAILNLLLNAVQAMPEGGELLVQVRAQRKEALLEVIDTGKGIAPQDLPKIFQIYYSTKPRGSGLGLAMTQRIIREHQGAIAVESEMGKGTRFILTLPQARPEDAGNPPPPG